MKRLAVLALVALAGCGGSKQVVKTTTTRVEVVHSGGGASGGFDAAGIYRHESPGVVTVLSVDNGAGGGGLGSGFVLNGQGEIVTNAHVVTTGEGANITQARQVFVEFADRNKVSAKVLGYDPDADVALLRVDPAGLDLHPLPLGVSGAVEVGEPVAAMGSPFGEEQSMSIGVVSALKRDVESLTRFRISGAIQTDAAINPGNSGGPLVDGQGRVIGINQQIATNSGGGEGVGFAVPIDLVKRSVAQLRAKGHVDYAYLGVQTQPIYPQLARRFHLPVTEGAWVQVVTPNTPAARAAIRAGSGSVDFQAERFTPGGDVITKLGAVKVTQPNDLADAVARYQPGQVVTATIWRGGKQRVVRLRLARRPLDIGSGR